MKFGLQALAALFLCGVSSIWAQQELTVQWKLTLQDLEQRLAALPDAGEAVAAWRDDAEALRMAIAEFAQANPADKIDVPTALPEGSPKQVIKDQLDRLNAAVQQVIDKTPGSPFNLGHVQVNVSAIVTEDSPVTGRHRSDDDCPIGSGECGQGARLPAGSRYSAYFGESQ